MADTYIIFSGFCVGSLDFGVNSVAYSHVSSVVTVDLSHYFEKSGTVRGCVGNAGKKNLIVYEFMNDCIFDLWAREVVTAAYDYVWRFFSIGALGQ